MNEQMMLAAIAACAATVDELTATVIALPAKLAEQVAEIRQGVATALHEQADATTRALGVADTLRADMGELAAGLRARLDAAEQARGETRQIIADNLASTNGTIGVLRNDLGAVREDIGLFVKQANEKVEEVRATLGEGAGKLALRVSEHANELFNLNALIPTLKTELAEQLVSVRSEIESVTLKLTDADLEWSKMLGANINALAKDHDEKFASTSARFEAIGPRLDVFEGKFTEAADNLEGVQNSIAENRVALSSSINKVAEDVLVWIGSSNDRTEALESNMPVVKQVLDNLQTSINTHDDMFKQTERVLHDTIKTEVDATSQKINEKSMEISSLADSVKTIEENLGIVQKSVDGRVEAVLCIVDENHKKQNTAIQGVVESLNEIGKSAEARSKQLIAPLADSVKTIEENLDTVQKAADGRVEAVLRTVEENEAKRLDAQKNTGTAIVANTTDIELLRKNEAVVVEKLAEINEKAASSLEFMYARYKGVENTITDLEVKLRKEFEEAQSGDRAQLELRFGASIEKVEQVLKQLEAGFESTDQRFAEFAAKHAGLTEEHAAVAKGVEELREQVGKDIDTRINKLLKALEEVPVGMSPEDLAQLQVRNAAMVDAQIGTALAAMRIETEYEDGKVRLVAVMPKHDGTESRSVVEIPVDIGIRYRGVYLENEQYATGDTVSHKGSMWVAKQGITGEPGTDITGWTLVVKRGNHGRDGHSICTFETHMDKNVYHEGDFLHWGNRLWQAKKDGRSPPELSQIVSTEAWALIGSLQ